MCRGTCEECPWKVKSQNNETITEHSKKHNKKHNCHMIPSDKKDGMWEDTGTITDETICVGCKEYFDNKQTN